MPRVARRITYAELHPLSVAPGTSGSSSRAQGAAGSVDLATIFLEFDSVVFGIAIWLVAGDRIDPETVRLLRGAH
jgi:hypothetical protein